MFKNSNTFNLTVFATFTIFIFVLLTYRERAPRLHHNDLVPVIVLFYNNHTCLHETGKESGQTV